jgi:hypothetical protein
LAGQILRYGSESIRKQDTKRITAGEMTFMRRTAGYTKWDHKRNGDTLNKLKIKPVMGYIQNYQRKWKEYVNRNKT